MPQVVDPALLSAIRGGNLVIFAGSGVCKDAGLPTWPGLLTQTGEILNSQALLDDHYLEFIRSLVASGDLTTAADLLAGRATRLELTSAVKQVLTPTRESAVIEALKCWRPRGIITTNFDRVTERLVEDHSWRLDNSESGLSLVSAAVGSGRPFIWKLHGDVDNALDPGDQMSARGGPFMVLTKGDFAALVQGDRGRQLSAGLFAVLQSYSIAFVGYSFTDPDIGRAMGWLAANIKFINRSWFISLDGDVRRSLPENVVEVSPIQEWAHLARWAREACDAATHVPRPARPARSGVPSSRELDAYRAVSRYLADLESPDLTERVIASALLEDMVQLKAFAVDWLVDRIGQILGVGPSMAESMAKATIRLLVEMGLVEGDDRAVTVRVEQAASLTGRASEGWAAERVRFFESIVQRLPAEAQSVSDEWVSKVEDALIVLCSNLGEGMAEWASRGIGSDIGWPDIDTVVSSFVEPEEERRLASSALRLLLTSPNDREVPYLYRILASTYLANTVRLNPIAVEQIRTSLGRYELYVDANVLLPLIVVDHPNHQSTKAVIDETIGAGVRLCVLPQFINEVVSHRNGARRELDEFAGDAKALGHLAEVLGPRTNVFVQGYLGQRSGGSIGQMMPWQKYLAQYTNNEILAAIHASRIEVVEPDAEATEGQLFADALVLIREEWRRKMGGPREEVLNNHEAVQFAHIYSRRRTAPEGQSHIWFLSNETVLQRVFQREPEKWLLPATFPYSAWVAFLNSRLIHGADDPGAIVRAILKGRPQAFELPSPVAIVRDKAFAGRVPSPAEEEALSYSFSDFSVMKRLEAAQRALSRRGQRGRPAREYSDARQEAVAEVSSALDAQIGRLRSELDQARIRISDLERKNSDTKPPPAPKLRGH